MRNILTGIFLTTGADGTNGGGLGGMLPMLAPFAVLILVFYFLILRPQKKKEKAQTEMRNSLSINDEVVTIGGIMGKVVSIKDDSVTIASGTDGTKIKFHKSAIQTINKASDDEPKTQQPAETKQVGDGEKKKFKFKK